jgi:DNA modification methylase
MLVFSASNLHFGPEVGVRGRKTDAPVFEIWYEHIKTIARDLDSVLDAAHEQSFVFHGDSRSISKFLIPGSIDAVFTSPPYPNEKDYTRTTRLESVLLGFIKNKEDLRKVKKTLLRSNTRGVYKGDADDQWIEGNKSVNDIANEIERRRIELGKNSGFEKLYARVTRLYFGGMARHLSELRPYLKPGAILGYVVGDQASYLQVMIRTGSLLAEIAESLGYEVVSIDLFRTRISTVTKAYMREEVLVLKWRG